MRSQPHSSSGVIGKRCFQSLIGRTVPQLARHLCPHRTPPPSPLILAVPKSHTRFRDPRWKSNSINQIIAQHAVGIPTSRLHANEAGRGCGKAGEGVCVCVCWEQGFHTVRSPQKLAGGGMRKRAGGGEGLVDRGRSVQTTPWLPTGLPASVFPACAHPQLHISKCSLFTAFV